MTVAFHSKPSPHLAVSTPASSPGACLFCPNTAVCTHKIAVFVFQPLNQLDSPHQVMNSCALAFLRRVLFSTTSTLLHALETELTPLLSTQSELFGQKMGYFSGDISASASATKKPRVVPSFQL